VYYYVIAEWAKNMTMAPMPSEAWFSTEYNQFGPALRINIGFQFELGKEQLKPQYDVAAPSDNGATRSRRLNEAERLVLAYA